ncbi:MAG: protoporphyrinogen oxidase, partial [Gemmataceae bacterium]
LVDAFVTGIFAGDRKLISLRAALPRLASWEQDHGGILRGFLASRRLKSDQNGSPENKKKSSTLWSFREGLSTLIEALGRNLDGSLHTRSPVSKIIPTLDGWKAWGEFQDQHCFDAVALTGPPPDMAFLLEPIDRDLSGRFQSLPMNRVAVVCLGYHREDVPHPLNGFGFLAPQGERRAVLGVQWCSSIFPGRAPEGKILLRAMCGGMDGADVFSLSEEDLKDQVRRELGGVMRIRAAPIFTQIIKWPQAIPQYPVGHLETVRWIQNRLLRHPGLFLAGNAFHGVAMNDCVNYSSQQAEAIATFLQRHSH